jgi:carboxymethylenebutenolidase
MQKAEPEQGHREGKRQDEGQPRTLRALRVRLRKRKATIRSPRASCCHARSFGALSHPTSMKHVLCFAALAVVSSVSAQEWAKARLDKSPRHLEWITVKNGDRTVKCFIGFPEVKNKATAVVLIHEIFGLSDWVRGVVDQFAEAGYIAIAPDFLSGMGPNGGGSDSFSPDAVRGKIMGLSNEQVHGDLDAAVGYVSKLPACNGKVVVGGFCWGGGKTFSYATTGKDIKAGLVFYGSAPKPEEMSNIKAPIYGFYGGNDARITAAVPDVIEQMKAAGKKYDPVTYEGAGHGFMRSGEDPAGTEPNKKAREEAWKRIKAIVGKI